MASPSARSSLVIGAFALVALLALAGAPGTAVAAADPCAAVDGDVAVVATPPSDEPAGPNGTVAVYRDSELRVHLCQPENGTRALDASDLDWATVLAASDERVRLGIHAAPNGHLGTLAGPGSVPGPALDVVDRSVETVLVDGSVPVPSADRGASLRAAEELYLERERAYERQLDALSNATAAVESGDQSDGEPVASTLAARRSYRNASEALRAELYAVADSRVGGPRSADAIVALDERSTALENRTTQRLRAHDEALREEEAALTRSVRVRVVGLVLVGALLGASVGAILPIRRGRAARRRLAEGEWTTYSRRSAYLPAAIGLVLLGLAVGWLALAVGDVLVEVVLP